MQNFNFKTISKKIQIYTIFCVSFILFRNHPQFPQEKLIF